MYNPAIIFFSSKTGVVFLPDKVELAEHSSSTFHTDDTRMAELEQLDFRAYELLWEVKTDIGI